MDRGERAMAQALGEQRLGQKAQVDGGPGKQAVRGLPEASPGHGSDGGADLSGWEEVKTDSGFLNCRLASPSVCDCGDPYPGT